MGRRAHRAARQAGSISAEFVAILFLVAGLVAVVIALALPDTVDGAGQVAKACLYQENCEGAPGGPPDQPGGAGDQPWYCDVFSLGCHDEPEDGSEDGDDETDGEEDGDDPTDQPWYCDVFGLGCHDKPGDGDGDDPSDDPSDEPSDDPADDVDIPDGLDPESDLVATLLSTDRGRETLQWLADNDIEIVVDSTQTGAVWNGSEIVIGEGYDDAAVIVHEANHARYDADGRRPDATSLSREDYVQASLEEEADGTVQQILAAKEFRDAGESAPQAPGEDAYDDAYQDAIDNGASAAEAREAGADAVLDEFTSGGFQTSNTGQSYPDYYGSYWDSVNP